MATRLTRRGLLAGAGALACEFATGLRAHAQFGLFGQREARPQPAPQLFVYIGCDTDKGAAKGIYLSRLDPATGHLSAPVLAAATRRPAYFAISPQPSGPQGKQARMLYVGNEGATAGSSAITCWEMDPATGELTQRGSVSAGGAGPCYVSVDVTGRSVFVADYAGGAFCSYRVKPDGTLSAPVDVLDLNDRSRFGAPGPRHDRQDAAHPHSASISPDNRFVVVNDLGTDRIWIFPFRGETAELDEPTSLQLRPGSGPRHVAFHPNDRWVYGIDELANRIDHYLWAATHAGATSQALLVDTGQSVSTIAPATVSAATTAAEIAISADGRFLYASNRAIAAGGEDTLVVFALNPKTGKPALAQRILCGGKEPRQFTFDPGGRWLLCGNQFSGSVTVFARDPSTGMLSGPVQTLAIDAPMFVTTVISG